MARPLRIDLAGGWYHVTARGLERRTIFRDDRERTHFLALLEEAVGRFGVVLHGYVLMDNHYHLIVETPEANLSPALQWVNVSYSVWFNRRHGRVGPLFQGRFKAVVAEPRAYAFELSRYVHLNPVRVKRLGLGQAARERAQAGMGGPAPAEELVRERVRRLRAYRWSSYRAYVGMTERPAWLVTERVLALGGGNPAEQRAQYREYVETAMREGLPKSPWDRLEAGLLLGGKEFVARLRRVANGNVQQQPALRALQRRASLADVVRSVERLKGEPWAQFRDQHGDWGRDLVFWLGRQHARAKLRDLAALAGITAEASVTCAIKRLTLRQEHDADLRKLMDQAEADLLNTKT
jgi:REP element-mobilizing transposase RayT